MKDKTIILYRLSFSVSSSQKAVFKEEFFEVIERQNTYTTLSEEFKRTIKKTQINQVLNVSSGSTIWLIAYCHKEGINTVKEQMFKKANEIVAYKQREIELLTHNFKEYVDRN